MKKLLPLLSVLLLFNSSLNAQLLTEGFENINNLPGWVRLNVSSLPPIDGSDRWLQGSPNLFPSHEGASNAYLATDVNASGCCIISNWIALPPLMVENGTEFTFYTRARQGSQFPDRLEVRVSTQIGTVFPVSSTDVGSFTELLLSINPDLEIGGYPEEWELQTIVVSGLSGPTDVRFAFRYFVTDGGLSGANSDYIGIDTVSVSEVLGLEETVFEGLNYFLDQNDQLNLSSNYLLQNIKVFDYAGRSILNQELNNKSETVNLSALSSGLYIVQINIEDKTKSFKIRKK